jgi:hypothetical protein
VKRHLAIFIAIVTASLAAAEPSKPESATIIDVPSERRSSGYHIGNIKVQFTDGHTEMWTRGGKCLMPQVSAKGHVGWTRYTDRNDYQEPVNNILRIRFPDGRIRDFEANGSFIEEWAFADNDSAVVIKSRGRHGPSSFVKYDLFTGRRLGVVGGSITYANLPEWAQPFADDKPKPSATASPTR